MLFVLQYEGDLYMSLVLLHCVVLAVLTRLALPTDRIHQVCRCWDCQCCIYLAVSTGTRNYVPFCS